MRVLRPHLEISPVLLVSEDTSLPSADPVVCSTVQPVPRSVAVLTAHYSPSPKAGAAQCLPADNVVHPDNGIFLSLIQEGQSATCRHLVRLEDAVLSESSRPQKDKSCRMPLA